MNFKEFKLAARVVFQRNFFKTALGLTLTLATTSGCAHIGPGNAHALFRETAIERELDEAAAHSTIFLLDRNALEEKMNLLEDTPGLTKDKMLEAQQKVIADAIEEYAQKHNIDAAFTKEVLQNLDKDPLVKKIALQHAKATSPSATPLRGIPAALVMVDDPERPFAPTAYEKKFLEEATGIPHLDKAFGRSFAEKARIMCLLHEYFHCGDKEGNAFLQTIATPVLTDTYAENNLAPVILASEIRADFPATRAYYKLFGDAEFLRDWADLRMLNTLKDFHLSHATQFELSRFINEIDPKGQKIPYIPCDNVQEKFIDLMKTIQPIPVTQEEADRNGSAEQMGVLRYKITALQKGLKNGQINDPDQRAIARMCVTAYEHCFEKIKAATPPRLLQKAATAWRAVFSKKPEAAPAPPAQTPKSESATCSGPT